MITPDEAVTRLEQAVSAALISRPAAANIRRWLGEPPFVKYRERLINEIEEERWPQLDNAFYTVLEFGTGGRRDKMYPVGTNVLNDRTIAERRADWLTM